MPSDHRRAHVVAASSTGLRVVTVLVFAILFGLLPAAYSTIASEPPSGNAAGDEAESLIADETDESPRAPSTTAAPSRTTDVAPTVESDLAEHGTKPSTEPGETASTTVTTTTGDTTTTSSGTTSTVPALVPSTSTSTTTSKPGRPAVPNTTTTTTVAVVSSTTTTTVGVVPSTTTTTGAWSGPSGVVWRGDAETGDLSQWSSVSLSGKADAEVVSSPTHSGNYAVRMINWDVDGSHNAGVRMTVKGPFAPDPRNLPDDAYYSAWYFVPFAFEGKSNIFQFKYSDVTRWDDDGNPAGHTRRMLWKTSLYWTEDGTYDMSFSTRIDQDTGEWQSSSIKLGSVDVNLPVGQWFHLEARYRFGQNGTGHTTVWVNGNQVWDRAGSTEASNLVCMHQCREWVAGHYLSNYQGYVAPGDSWIFLDDAIVNTTRTGP